uniref:Nucleolysin TIAR (Trinotate prediction) n=1 Tax=Henneguya salminicola TaxID=69463 RepID=A0A6G3MJ63_HENSL
MSKGYGFVVFADQNNADCAINRMNGNLLGTRPVKVSWATRNKSGQAPAPLNYTDVYNQSAEGNTTIYVGGLPAGMDDLSCRQFFEPYGILQECKYFPDKRYAFIKFDTHEAGATAIVRCNGQMVDGSMIKCWWSKDNSTTAIVGSTSLVLADNQSQPPSYQPSSYPYYPNY